MKNMNTPRFLKPSLNGHHDPVELDRKQHLQQLQEKAQGVRDFWSHLLFGFGLVVALTAFILSLIAVFK